MILVANWRRVLRRAWSVRAIAFAALFSALEVALPFLEGVLPVPRGVFAALSAGATALAFIFRILAQKEFDDADQQSLQDEARQGGDCGSPGRGDLDRRHALRDDR